MIRWILRSLVLLAFERLARCSQVTARDPTGTFIIGTQDSYPPEIESKMHNLNANYSNNFSLNYEEDLFTSLPIGNGKNGFIQASLLIQKDWKNLEQFSNLAKQAGVAGNLQPSDPCRLYFQSWEPKMIEKANISEVSNSKLVDYAIIDNTIYILMESGELSSVNFQVFNKYVNLNDTSMLTSVILGINRKNWISSDLSQLIQDRTNVNPEYFKLSNGYWNWTNDRELQSEQVIADHQLKSYLFIISNRGVFRFHPDKPTELPLVTLPSTVVLTGLVKGEVYKNYLILSNKRFLYVLKLAKDPSAELLLILDATKLKTPDQPDEQFVDFIAALHDIKSMNSTLDQNCTNVNPHCLSILGDNQTDAARIKQDLQANVEGLFILTNKGVYLYYLRDLEKASMPQTVSKFSYKLQGGSMIKRYGRFLHVVVNEVIQVTDSIESTTGQVFEFALPETSELTDQSFTDSSQVFKLNRVVVNHGKVTDLKIDNQFMYVISSTKIKIHSIGIPKEIDAASASFSVIWPKLNGTLAPVLILGVPFLVEFDHQFAQVLTKPVTTPSLLCSRSLVYAGVFQYQLNVTTRECAGSAPNTQLCR